MATIEQAFKRLDLYIEQNMKAYNVPGIAVAVTNREKLLHVSTCGYADVAARIPVTPEVLFEIGSIGKSFTSIALLQLQQEGLLDLHKPVTHYLPWFKVQSEYEPITLHHLMCHTAGITNGAELPGDPHYEVWTLREVKTIAAPGTYYHYSDAGYKTLGVVLEEVLGQSYGDIIQERILNVLGMTASGPIVINEIRKRLAVGYEDFYDDRPMPKGFPFAPARWLEHAEGAGSIVSTPADMAIYLRMLMNRGQGPRNRILSEESFNLMTQKIIDAEEEEDGSFYGYGIIIHESNGHTYISHDGCMPGYLAYMVADMDDGLGIVVLMNGPAEQCREEIAMFGFKLLRAAFHDKELPPVHLTDPTRIVNSTDYVGTYRACSKQGRKASVREFSLVAEGERLFLHYFNEDIGNKQVMLEERGPDCFYVDHPDFKLFLLSFEREDGQVVEAFYGSDWYTNERYTGPMTFDYPDKWNAYPGHYSSYNPWLTNFRIVLCKGLLVFIVPFMPREPLVALGDGTFKVGEEDKSPERIRFDTIINGRAFRVNYSSCDYYRTFTP